MTTLHNTTLLTATARTNIDSLLYHPRGEEMGTDYFLRGLETLVAVLSVEPLAAFGTFDHRGLVAAEDNELVWRRRGRDTN